MRALIGLCCLLAWPTLTHGQAPTGTNKPANPAEQDATVSAANPGATTQEHTHTRDVRAIVLDGERVWVATSGGLATHARADGRYLDKLGAAHGLPATSVLDAALLRDGTLLIATEQGAALVRDDGDEREVRPLPDVGRRGRFDPARVVLGGPRGEPAVLYMQSGLVDLDGKPLRATPPGLWSSVARGRRGVALGALDGRLSLPAADGTRTTLTLPHPVLALAAVGDGFVVAGAESLARWNGSRLEPLRHAGRDVAATAFGRGAGGELLVGTAAGLVLALRDTTLEPLARVDGRVTALAGDGASLWLGVSGQGLGLIKGGSTPASFAQREPSWLRPEGEICSNHVTRIARHRGVPVAGSFDGGACYLRDGSWSALPLDAPYVHGVVSDGERLWIAHSNGIARFDRAFAPLPIGAGDPEALREASGRAATYAALGPGGRVLFASPSGVLELTRLPGGRYRAHVFERGRGVPGHITALARTETALYVASETRGVSVLADGRRPQALRDPVHLPEAWVTALTVGERGLWVGTCQRGAAQIGLQASGTVAEGFRAVARADGLPGERVIALAEHPHGMLIGTLSGLGLAGEGDVRELALPLPDRRVASLFVDGERLWVGTENGLAVFAGRL